MRQYSNTCLHVIKVHTLKGKCSETFTDGGWDNMMKRFSSHYKALMTYSFRENLCGGL